MKHRVVWRDKVAHRGYNFIYTFTFPSLNIAMEFALALYDSVEVDRESVCIHMVDPEHQS